MDSDPNAVRNTSLLRSMTALERWGLANGVKVIPIPPYKHNHTIESMMGVVLHLLNCLLVAAYLSSLFWARAFLHAIALLNRRGSYRSKIALLQGGHQTRYQAIKEAMEDLIIAAYHLPGTDNGSDMMTKILGPRLKHRHAMTSLGWGNSPQASETNSVSVTRRPHT